ncbi:MAG: Rrf2 family transcriptional regulator [Flavipsychrobacter sp.]
MFSKTCEYAIKAVIYIAQKSKDGVRIGIKEIAKGIDSPEHFIAKILQDLSKKGLVQSMKGPNGGFYLDVECLDISLADIVKEIDGDKVFTACGLGLKQCNANKPCPIHNQYQEIRQKTHDMLKNAKIGEFAEKLERNTLFLKR